MLLQRVATAAVGIPIIVAVIAVGNAPYAAVAAALLALCVLEFFHAVEAPQATPAGTLARRLSETFLERRPIAYVAAGAAVALVVAADNGYDVWTGAFAGAVGVSFIFLILLRDPVRGLRDWLSTIGAVAYIGFLGSHLVLLRDATDGAEWVVLAVFSTFIADTFAYFIGRSIGSTRIIPEISPNKTLEGTTAGLLTGIAAVIAFNYALNLDVELNKLLPLAILLPIAAFFGDLAESMIKRGAGIKDTSDFVPGHGGFLDRIDAVLFTVPLVYYWLIWVIL